LIRLSSQFDLRRKKKNCFEAFGDKKWISFDFVDSVKNIVEAGHVSSHNVAAVAVVVAAVVDGVTVDDIKKKSK
jgi:hypothetical protein